MGTISINKIGGLALILGPVVALVFYLLQPGGSFIDAADPANAGETINAMVSNATLGKVVSIIVPIGLIVFLFGILVLQGNVSSGGNGDALSRVGAQFILFGVIGWVISTGASLAITGSGLPADQATAIYGSLYSATLGIGTVAGIIAGIGFLSFALGLSTRDDVNQIAALVVAIASIVLIVVTIIGGVDSSQLETMGIITGICFLITTLWSILLGLDLLKKE